MAGDDIEYAETTLVDPPVCRIVNYEEPVENPLPYLFGVACVGMAIAMVVLGVLKFVRDSVVKASARKAEDDKYQAELRALQYQQEKKMVRGLPNLKKMLREQQNPGGMVGGAVAQGVNRIVGDVHALERQGQAGLARLFASCLTLGAYVGLSKEKKQEAPKAGTSKKDKKRAVRAAADAGSKPLKGGKTAAMGEGAASENRSRKA